MNLLNYLCSDEIMDAYFADSNEILKLISEDLKFRFEKHRPSEILEEIKRRTKAKDFTLDETVYYPGSKSEYRFLAKLKTVYTCLAKNQYTFDKELAKQWRSAGYRVRRDIRWYCVQNSKGEKHYFMKGEIVKSCLP